MNSPPEDSLRKRYVVRAGSNVFAVLVGLVTLGLVPRGLGPAAFGDFQFLKNFFAQVAVFFDLGATTCYYTKLSARPGERGLSMFFWRYAAAAVLGMAAITTLGFFSPFRHAIWQNQKPVFIALALALGALTWIVGILSQMADAFTLTVKAEIIRMVNGAALAAATAALYVWGRLGLSAWFALQLALLVFLAVPTAALVLRHGNLRGPAPRPARQQTGTYGREFFDFVHPLAAYTLTGAAVLLAQRWMLQRFGGSVQQGFFGLSFQISTVCVLAAASMTSLITREFAVAHEAGSLDTMRALFRKYLPLLFAITAYFSCFLFVEAERVVSVLGGARFAGAVPAARIMALYPLSQTYGQLSGTLFFATGRTRLYRNIGVASLLAGLALTWTMLAPRSLGGLDAGALGLAGITVGLGLLTVNVQLFYNTQFLSVGYAWYLVHQAVATGGFLAAAYGGRWAISALAARSPVHGPLPLFLASGCLYTLLAAALVIAFPQLLGLSRAELRRYAAVILKR